MNSDSNSNKIEATKEHCAYCFDVIQAALNGEATAKSFPPLPSAIKDISTPLFVTWQINKDELRGCIGTFSSQSIAKNLPKYAYISAFQDDRFDPISKKEVPNLSCSVSLLVNFEKAKDAFDWEVGVHGIEIDLDWKNRSYGATFLPEVAAEENWTKEETLKHLLRKAGYSGSLKDVQDHIKLERYQSSKSEMSYQEYVAYRNKS